jgi:hypothetical protein
LRSPYLWLTAIFVLSRIVYYAAGVRFDASPLQTFFQIFDPLLLRTRLWETLYYAHTYPPGFNLMIGLVLKAFPVNFVAAFHVLYMLCGLATTFALLDLFQVLGVSSLWAVLLTALFIASPEAILYENFLAYEYPMLALMCITAICFYKLIDKPTVLMATALFSLVAVLVVFRSIFHIGYMLLIVGVLLVLLKGNRRMLIATAALPFLLAFSTYAKNWILYGKFFNSSWMGFNIYTITTYQLTPDEMDRYIEQGKISPIERIAMGTLSEYSSFVTIPPPKGIPILDQPMDSNGRPNFNQLAYFQVQDLYIKDGKYVLAHSPKAYLRSVEKAWFAYFLPATDFPNFTSTREAIRAWDRAFNVIVFGQFRDARNRKELRRLEAGGTSPLFIALYTGTFLILALPLLFVFGCWMLVQAVRKYKWPLPRTALLGFVMFHILMITSVVNLLSSFENNRYRVPIDGFFLLLLGMAITSVQQWITRSQEQEA